MGTNYYLHMNQCKCCNRYDEVHIGKSWRMFRGYRIDPNFPAERVGPVGPVESWQDWKRVLKTTPDAQVFDEYGCEHHVDDFIADVESVPQDRRGSQMRWLVDHNYPLGFDWVDDEGYDFHEGEFS